MPEITIAKERLGDCLGDLRPLLERHKQLVGGQLDCGAGIDWELFLELEQCGALYLLVARKGRSPVGYIFWTLAQSGLEYKDIPHAIQGPWYVKSGLRNVAVGRQLFQRSVADLRSRGFRYVLPHHWTSGSGAKLGKFFTELGAQPIEVSYILDLNTPTS